MVTAAVSLRSPRIKETKVRKTCQILVEQLLADNMPPAVGRHCFAPCSHAGGLAAAYGLTDKNWKNMGASRRQDSGDLPFFCLPKMVPVQIYILHVLIWIKCGLISIISVISDRVSLLFPLDEKWRFDWFAFFLSFFLCFSCWNMQLRVCWDACLDVWSVKSLLTMASACTIFTAQTYNLSLNHHLRREYMKKSLFNDADFD